MDDFTVAKFVCRNVPPSCGIPCLAGHEACRQGVENILDTGQLPDGTTLANCSGGTNACDQTFQTAKQACFDASCPSGQTCTSCQPTDQGCNDCVDVAQVNHFTCRDACRDSWRTNAVVIAMRQLCKTTFQTCIKACKNP